jgi:hypothetical protein
MTLEVLLGLQALFSLSWRERLRIFDGFDQSKQPYSHPEDIHARGGICP